VALSTIHHVQVAMPAGGEERARRFFGGLLGLAELPKPANLRGRGGVWFATGNLELHLGVDADFRPARKAHVALQVADLAGLRERLGAAGHPTTEDEPLPDHDRCYVADPFGNRLELLEPV
jgi:catechol 2,3-dioxygenase-like lactoylglutathione lyase family enzyme